MSTQAQITANIANAQASSGPRSDSGKAASSKNSVVFGLYSGDFVRSGEESISATLHVALLRDLAPVGTLEEILAEEIHRAAWRLRRCGAVESHLVMRLDDGEHYVPDPMENSSASAEKIQKSVDRARSQANRLLHKSIAELRKLQTQRQYRNEIFEPGADLSKYGLADWQSINKSLAPRPGGVLPQPNPEKSADDVNSSPVADATSNPNPQIGFVLQTAESQPSETPRNARCPCGSGQKHKRCCGKSAPAMRNAA